MNIQNESQLFSTRQEYICFNIELNITHKFVWVSSIMSETGKSSESALCTIYIWRGNKVCLIPTFANAVKKYILRNLNLHFSQISQNITKIYKIIIKQIVLTMVPSCIIAFKQNISSCPQKTYNIFHWN